MGGGEVLRREGVFFTGGNTWFDVFLAGVLAEDLVVVVEGGEVELSSFF